MFAVGKMYESTFFLWYIYGLYTILSMQFLLIADFKMESGTLDFECKRLKWKLSINFSLFYNF
jgi:hypothetical protein